MTPTLVSPVGLSTGLAVSRTPDCAREQELSNVARNSRRVVILISDVRMPQNVRRHRAEPFVPPRTNRRPLENWATNLGLGTKNGVTGKVTSTRRPNARYGRLLLVNPGRRDGWAVSRLRWKHASSFESGTSNLAMRVAYVSAYWVRPTYFGYQSRMRTSMPEPASPFSNTLRSDPL